MTNEDTVFYKEFMPILEDTQKFILKQISDVLSSMSNNSETDPVEHLRSRIKSSSSLKEKLISRGLSFTPKSAFENLSDIIGIRIVTHFIGDIYSILERLQKISQWKIVKIKDYISNPKPNGYRSLHIIIEIPLNDTNMKSIKAEIQMRTIAMDCWASLEHQMRYKKNISNTTLLEEELKRCADEMASTDLSMQTIRDMIQSQ